MFLWYFIKSHCFLRLKSSYPKLNQIEVATNSFQWKMFSLMFITVSLLLQNNNIKWFKQILTNTFISWLFLFCFNNPFNPVSGSSEQEAWRHKKTNKPNHDTTRLCHFPLVYKTSKKCWGEDRIYGISYHAHQKKKKTTTFVGRNRNVVTCYELQTSGYYYRSCS